VEGVSRRLGRAASSIVRTADLSPPRAAQTALLAIDPAPDEVLPALLRALEIHDFGALDTPVTVEGDPLIDALVRFAEGRSDLLYDTADFLSRRSAQARLIVALNRLWPREPDTSTKRFRLASVFITRPSQEWITWAISQQAPEVSPRLFELTDPRRRDHRRKLAHMAFIHCGGTALPFLREAMSLPDSDLRREAFRMLHSIGQTDSQTTDSVVRALTSDGDRDVRKAAAQAITSIGAPQKLVVSVLRDALEDSEPMVRAVVIAGLGRCKDDAKSVIPRLIEIGTTDEPSIPSVASALSRTGPEARRAVPLLVGELAQVEHSERVRRAISMLESLGSLADEAIPALERLAVGRDERWGLAARTVLRKIRGE